MGILFLFVLIVMGFIAIVGAMIVYQLGYWIIIKWMQLSFPTHWLWTLVCTAAGLLNLSGLLFLLNDAKNDTPDPSLIWKIMMVISVLLSTLTYFIGLRFIKQ